MYQIEGVTKSARRQRREHLLVNGVLDDSDKIATDTMTTNISPSSTQADENPVVETCTQNTESSLHTDVQREINPESEHVETPLGTQPSIFWFIVLCISGGGFVAGAFYFLKYILNP